MERVQHIQEALAKPVATISTSAGGIGIAGAADILATVGSVFQSLGFIAGGTVSMFVLWNYINVNYIKRKTK